MTKIVISEDCGNSPKNTFVQKLTIALASADAKFILDNVTDDIHWNIVGDELIQGKDNIARALGQRKNDQAAMLKIQHIATHGKAGTVNGTRTSKKGKTLGFCNVYEFKDSRASSVKEITSYVIETK